ncbi:hypothetical protein QM716_11685 [Rhodococcus sp. IEGM 1409]|uniref:hypothetical protein n=1 Tax=Rhodococcus sp. IEGM 1409 TaxID=3047082 RepID=UPI0024B7FA98|nr:hypothetical protein [Rhodococcus sp. IEGM 1409]MDI9900515.1 hypothetical protein [Rhodococcus sp. IEGM 1409]
MILSDFANHPLTYLWTVHRSDRCDNVFVRDATSRGSEFWSGHPFVGVVDHGVRHVCDSFRKSLFTRQKAEIWCDDHTRAVFIEEDLKAGELIAGGKCSEKCSLSMAKMKSTLVAK